KNVSQRSWYQNSQSKIYVGDVHEALLLAKLLPNPTDEPLRFVDIAAPVKDSQGNFVGVIGAHLSWSWAKEVEQSIGNSLGKNRVEVLILSRDNTVLLGPKELQGKKLELLMLKTDRSQNTGFSSETWSDRKVYVTGYARTQGYRDYPGLGWTVLVRQQQQIALAPARSLQNRVFICGTGLGLLFAIGSWFRSRRIIEPLLQLTKAAEKIGGDDRHTQIPSSDRQDELATLSKAFQQMVQALNDREDRLQAVNEQLKLDIEKREQAEQKVREQAALLDIASDAIFVRALDGTILFWNCGAERIYAWKADEVLGQNAKTLLNRDTSSQLEEAEQKIIEQGEWRGELKKINKSGHVLIVDSHWTLARDLSRNPKFILTVDTDITEKKQLEAQFLRAQRLESLGTLAGGIAHDMNNILTPIMATAQLLQLKFTNLDDRDRRLLQILLESSRRGADLVKQILSFARGFEGERATIQIKHILKEVQQIVQNTFPKSIAIEFEIPTQELWTISADATQLHQVLMNLCVNARDAMPDGGVLTIAAGNFSIDRHNVKMHPDAKVGEYIAVTVSDTGEGMSPEIIDRIFEPFYTTKEIGKGTGLGLSTVLGIVNSHGGFVNVYSEVERGTRFVVYLPADFKAETKTIEDEDMPTGFGELILVVDDEALILEIAQNSLQAYGYQIITAKNGKEAILRYQQYRDRVRVVLIDMMMPELGGFRAIEEFLAIDPQLKIIATSGLIKEEATITKVNAFLPKPYTLKKLLSTLQLVLRQKTIS
ncbi:MAG: ATP-binding protein, partial [Xenococcaceae cyanobacterium]